MNTDLVLWVHVATGVIAWIVGAIALWTNFAGRRSRGALAAFHWSVFGVAVRSLPTLIGVPLLELWYRRAAALTPRSAHP